MQSKFEVAEIHLRRAITVFLKDGDCFPALTLAAAAEEIIGSMLQEQGKENSREHWRRIILLLTGKEEEDKIAGKEIGDFLNYPKNSSKHYKVGERKDFGFDVKEAAKDAIDNGIRNFHLYTGDYPEWNEFYEFREATIHVDTKA